MNQKAASITELNTYIKMLLDNDEVLQNVYVLGEISNFKKHSSGHLYFSLKDEKCSVKCMMFSYYTSIKSLALSLAKRYAYFHKKD